MQFPYQYQGNVAHDASTAAWRKRSPKSKLEAHKVAEKAHQDAAAAYQVVADGPNKDVHPDGFLPDQTMRTVALFYVGMHQDYAQQHNEVLPCIQAQIAYMAVCKS